MANQTNKNKRTSGGRRSAPQTAARKNTSAGKNSNTSKNSKNTRAKVPIEPGNSAAMIVLFALSVFLFFVTLIEGDSLWFSMHCFVLGVFGSLSIVWAIFLVYIASGMAAGRKGPAFGARCVKLAVALLFAAMFIYVFFEGKDYHFKGAENKYGEILSACYEEAGRGNGIGLNGAVTGAFLGKLFGLSGAKVITVLSIIVYIMLATRAKTDFVYNAVNWLKEHLGILFENTKKWIADYKIKSAKRKEQRIALEAARREEEEKERIRAEEEAAQKAEQAAQKAEKEAERSKRKFVDLNNVPEAPMPVKPAADSGFAQMLDEIADDDEDYEDDDEDVPPPVENDRMRGDAAYMRLKEALGFEDDYHTVKQQNKGFSRLSLFEPMAEIEIAPDENDEDNISTIEPIAEDELVPPEDVMHEENADFYRFPPISLLNEPKGGVSNGITAEIEENGAKLVETLKSFGVATEIINISKGPAVTRYELKPMAGVKISRITGLSDDIALNLAAKSIRIEAPIPGKPAVGIEIPNKGVDVVPLREIIDTNEFTVAKSKTTVALGRDIGGQPAFADISKMPHLLIAGSTGSGKSVCINTIIVSILYKASPDEVKLLMVDPKMVELGVYNGIPHLLVPVVTDAKKAAGALAWAVTEMMRRYQTFADNDVRNISGYNSLADITEGMKRMEQIVIIIDELADLMMVSPHEVEDSIFRLAQMARAAGMYLIIATQRPSVDVITGVIKANIPSRIAFAVSSQVDSRTIIDTAGADKLLGRGDMLFLPMGESKTKRIQGCFVSDEEIERVVEYIKKRHDTEYDEEISQEIDHQAELAAAKGKGSKAAAEEGSEGIEVDDLMMQAVEFVVDAGQASTSMLQRRLRVGYARAGRLIDEMEQMGIVGPHEGSKARTVLMTKTQFLEWKANGASVPGTEESSDSEE